MDLCVHLSAWYLLLDIPMLSQTYHVQIQESWFLHKGLNLLYPIFAHLSQFFQVLKTYISFLFSVSTYDTFCGLKQHKFTFLQSGGQKSEMSLIRLKSRCCKGWFLLEAPEPYPFLLFFFSFYRFFYSLTLGPTSHGSVTTWPASSLWFLLCPLLFTLGLPW